MNLANKLTVGRLVIAAFFFGTMELAGPHHEALVADWFDDATERRYVLLNVAFLLFFVAGLTDVADGWVARRYDMISDFGRIADPFCDKVMICGSFVYLTTLPVVPGANEVYVPAWVAVLIIAREFLVTGLRGFLEARGHAFGAMISGKLKMVFQCLTIGCALLTMANVPTAEWATTLTRVMVWSCLAATLLSGWTYVSASRRLLGSDAA